MERQLLDRLMSHECCLQCRLIAFGINCSLRFEFEFNCGTEVSGRVKKVVDFRPIDVFMGTKDRSVDLQAIVYINP
ncbi:hypothetical protein V6N13_000338 [Hibiscus sabdariffa]|uniref:Uncharacterized protein n=1 Tax=Hibiscus sabdariffa TaxID=183260 RepID=A0ABR2G5G8_9ROSI